MAAKWINNSLSLSSIIIASTSLYTIRMKHRMEKTNMINKRKRWFYSIRLWWYFYHHHRCYFWANFNFFQQKFKIQIFKFHKMLSIIIAIIIKCIDNHYYYLKWSNLMIIFLIFMGNCKFLQTFHQGEFNFYNFIQKLIFISIKSN